MSSAVVTGIGVLSAIGCDKEDFLDGLRQSRCGIQNHLTFRNGKPCPSPYGSVADLDSLCATYLDAGRLRRWDPVSRMAYLACVMALRDAGLMDAQNHWVDADPNRVGLVLASGFGGLESTENFFRKVAEDMPQSANPSLFPETVPNAATGHVSIELGIKGPNTTFTQRQISSESALRFAVHLLEKSDLDCVITGAVEDLAQWGMLPLFHAGLLAKSQRGNPPILRPFDRERNGTLLGEGGAIFILEREEKALKRRGKSYGKFIAQQITGMPAQHGSWPKGPLAADALLQNSRNFLEMQKISPNQIAYVSSCALGDKHLDRMEAELFLRLFGEKKPVTALCGATGSFLCQSSLRVAAAFLSFQEGFIPASVGLQNPENPSLNHLQSPLQNFSGDTVLLHTLADGGGHALTLIQPTGQKS